MAAKRKSKEQIAADQGEWITAVCADTLYRISRAYGVSVPDLLKLNPGITNAFIRKGEKVRVK